MLQLSEEAVALLDQVRYRRGSRIRLACAFCEAPEEGDGVAEEQGPGCLWPRMSRPPCPALSLMSRKMPRERDSLSRAVRPDGRYSPSPDRLSRSGRAATLDSG
jgi:hypothetical protein